MKIRKIYYIDIYWTSLYYYELTIYKRTLQNKKKKICKRNKTTIFYKSKFNLYSKQIMSLRFTDTSLSDSIFDIASSQLSLC